jgi:DNA repair protein RecO (recombination protein O)
MPARETEAIILKTFPLGEADRLVSFFSRSAGRMRGVASGARKLKNRFGSTLGVLSYVQLWYTERETRDLVRIQQSEPIESFHKVQSVYELSTGFAAISEIAERVLPEHEASEPMFRLTLLAARETERTGSWQLPLAYFAFWTVRLGGWLPRFDRCSNCSAPFGAAPGFHGSRDEGLLCEKCRHPGMKPLGVVARKLAGQFINIGLDKLQAADAPANGVAELREASLDWIEHHTEHALVTRKLLEPSGPA